MEDDLVPKTIRLPASVWLDIVVLQHHLRLPTLAETYLQIAVAGIAALYGSHPEINRDS